MKNKRPGNLTKSVMLLHDGARQHVANTDSRSVWAYELESLRTSTLEFRFVADLHEYRLRYKSDAE